MLRETLKKKPSPPDPRDPAGVGFFSAERAACARHPNVRGDAPNPLDNP